MKRQFSDEASEWLRNYHGSIDATALLLAFDAGRADRTPGHIEWGVRHPQGIRSEYSEASARAWIEERKGTNWEGRVAVVRREVSDWEDVS